MIGLKTNEEKEFELTFPEKYHNKNLAGKPAKFKVKLLAVYKRTLPELNDDFAKGLGIESMTKLKEQVHHNVEHEEHHKEEERVEIEMLEKLIDKSQFNDVISCLRDFGILEKNAEQFIEILKTSDSKEILKLIEKDQQAKNEMMKLEQIIELLKNVFDIKNCEIKMSIVRGLDYYKGIVFEIDAPILGAEKQLCGGGAYELITLFGGKETSTSGFAIGFDRTILALELEKYNFPKQKLDVFVIPVNEKLTKKSLEITQDLRKQGLSVDMDLLKRGISKSLKYASSIDVDKIIIVGEKELENDSVTIRDMKTGKQELVKINNLYQKIH